MICEFRLHAVLCVDLTETPCSTNNIPLRGTDDV